MSGCFEKGLVAAILFSFCGCQHSRQCRCDSAEIKVGIIGCDTSHAIRFTEVLNVRKPDFAAGFRVTAAHKWGSRDIVSATNRYEKYIAQLKDMGVEMCETVDDLLAKVDVVCLETNDGREHLWQAEKCFRAKKRVFIDKPIAQDYPHAKKIYDLGRQLNAKYFSSSILRYSEIAQACRSGKNGRVLGAQLYAPSPIEEQGTHSRFAWYGIHGFEPLVTVMGVGAESVIAVNNGDEDVSVVKYRDGRIGTVRSRHSKWDYGGTIFCERGKPVVLDPAHQGYEPLLKEICAFFRTGLVPVRPEETLEIFAIMDAADRSIQEGGREVKLSEIRNER